MTYLDLIRDADCKIDNGDITLGEYEKMIDPLKREIQPERTPERTETHACDLIDRQAAIELAMQYCPDDDGSCGKADRDIRELLDDLENLPSAQTERKKGKWTDNNACPFCGFQPWYERDIHTLSYCPNCGADMRKDGD